LTPATALGLEHRIGTISVGADANLLVLNQDLTLRQVVLRGRLVDVNG
jgi:N-acetylglucosamine-6-phosphate deacetylase